MKAALGGTASQSGSYVNTPATPAVTSPCSLSGPSSFQPGRSPRSSSVLTPASAARPRSGGSGTGSGPGGPPPPGDEPDEVAESPMATPNRAHDEPDDREGQQDEPVAPD